MGVTGISPTCISHFGFLETLVSVRQRASISACGYHVSSTKPPVSVEGFTMSTRGLDESYSGLFRLPELLLCLPEYRQQGKRQEVLLCRLKDLLYPQEGLPYHLKDFLRWPSGLLYWPEGLLYHSGLLISTRGSPHFVFISAKWPRMSARAPSRSNRGLPISAAGTTLLIRGLPVLNT